MASISCTFYSEILEKEVQAFVFLPAFTFKDKGFPEEERYFKKRKFKTLVLLHGYSGTFSSWQRNTRLEYYAEQNDLAVICPDGNNGHYSDWESGPRYLSFLNDEFLPATRSMFPLSTEKEDNFIGGYSMGGYGAVKWAFTYPDIFSHVINFSGGLNILPRIEYYKKMIGVEQTKAVFGNLDEIENSRHDIYWLMQEYMKNDNSRLRIYSCSGTEDLPATEAHMLFVRIAEKLGYDITTFTGPGGHDFDFWDEVLKKVIYQWLPL